MTETTKKTNYNKINMYRWKMLLLDGLGNAAGGRLISAVPLKRSTDGQRSNFVPVAASKYARVFKFDINLSDRSYNLFLKIFLFRGVGDFLKHFVRPPRARRAFDAGLMLNQNNFSAPVSIAMGRRKILGIIPTADFLITSEVADAKQFHILLEELDKLSDRQKQKRNLLRQLGKTIGQMHAAGIFHGDLRLGNILVQKAPDNTENFTFTFLDNERTKKFRQLPNRLRIKNLVQVNMFEKALSGTDRMRFFAEYVKACQICLEKKRETAASVITKTSRRLTAKRS